MKKRGLSTVIATILMIALVLVTTIIVWTAVENMIRKKTEGAQSCFDIGASQKITINEDYTCYNSTDDFVQVSVSVEDVDIDGLIISISSEGNSMGFTLRNNPEIINNGALVNYPDQSTYVSMPQKNSGKTYIALGFTSPPTSIKIAPIVGDKQCEAVDQISQIEDCRVFV